MINVIRHDFAAQCKCSTTEKIFPSELEILDVTVNLDENLLKSLCLEMKLCCSQKIDQKEHRGLWCLNADGPVIG
jgi:hypothetical protein